MSKQVSDEQAGLDDTREEIHRVGHRRFTGGKDDLWELIGDLQFNFLVDRGLAPSDTLVDIGCGALRGGTKFIRYLDPGRYLGIDKHIELIVYGVATELGIADYRKKQPIFVVSDCFEFHKFRRQPNFAIAQSLFTHLCEKDLLLCLERLRLVAARGCRFFATFFEVDEPFANQDLSHSHAYFAYTRSQIEMFGKSTGWAPNYIGAWNHPRGQHMIEYVAT